MALAINDAEHNADFFDIFPNDVSRGGERQICRHHLPCCRFARRHGVSRVAGNILLLLAGRTRTVRDEQHRRTGDRGQSPIVSHICTTSAAGTAAPTQRPAKRVMKPTWFGYGGENFSFWVIGGGVGGGGAEVVTDFPVLSH